jgi:alginate O-acetyltransferase complex protein AlgJ
MKKPSNILLGFLCSSALLCQQASATDLATVAKAKTATPALHIAGDSQPWRFVFKEMVHLSHGDLSRVEDLSAINTEGTDPLPVITEYHKALQDLGVDLILVPVPAKAAVYPDALSTDLQPALPPLSAFISKLNTAGVRTLDLAAIFFEQRMKQPDQPLYCTTDSHWSPAGAQLAARHAAKILQQHPALKDLAPTTFNLNPDETIQIHGDLIADEEKASLPPEALSLQSVSPQTSGDSPILVIGDSHCQIFRTGGNMLASNAGFIDHLAQQLSLPIEEVSSQASGADQPRADIARRTAQQPDFWENRKIVLWLFTEREFTQGRWRSIPALVQKK